jgi:hypothetical protein
MSAAETTTRAPRLEQILLLAVFAIGLLAPGLGMLGGWSADIAAIEFRNPTPAPSMPGSFAELEALPPAVDAYLDDHFGFRGQLLTLNSLVHVVVLGSSPTPMFLLGKDGWFFHRTMDDSLDQVRGVNRFTPRELERWVRMMEANQRWLAARGVRMLITIAPSKASVYPEFLPDWANIVDEDRRYRQLMRRVARGSTLEFVDLLTPLLAAKERFRVYHKNDGHWNQLGAYVAYAAIVDRVRETLPQVPLRSLDEFDIEWSRESTGAMTNRLNIAPFVQEEVPRLHLKEGSHMLREFWPDGVPEGVLDTLHATSVIDSDLIDLPTIVFVRDSFATDVSLFARESFHRTVLIHHGYGGFRRSLIMKYEPDIVVYEMIERGLIWKPRLEN